MNPSGPNCHPACKRYCKTLELRDDPALIKSYIEVHRKVWPEIIQGIREVGILSMEIYIYKTHLFMIMDTVPDFDHDAAMAELAQKPRQTEWEAYVATFQNASAHSRANEKWQLMENIFQLG